jgi:hypothetical protein
LLAYYPQARRVVRLTRLRARRQRRAELGPRSDPELRKHPVQVRADGAMGEVEPLPNLAMPAAWRSHPTSSYWTPPDFPEHWKSEAIAHTKALDYYRSVEDLDWTFVSPAAFIHPGERTGRYRLGGDQLLVDDNGNSEVSAEDYAIAIADLLEKGGRERERITVAW